MPPQVIEYNNAVDTYAAPSRNGEYGLFARAPMSKGDIIVRFDNPNLWSEQRYYDLSPEIKKKRWFVMIGPERCLVSSICTSFSFINHSDKPTAYIDEEMRQVIALSDIKKDEEITLDFKEHVLVFKEIFPNLK
jgi:SET domain-containing protein